MRKFKVVGFVLIGLGLATFVGALLYIYQLKRDPTEFVQNNLLNSASAIGSTLAAVGLTLASIGYTIGEWYPFFRKFRDLGIVDANASRRGRELAATTRWVNELVKAKKSVVLAGITHGGWFLTGWDELRDALPTILRDIERFEVFILNPLGPAFGARRIDELVGGDKHKLDDTQERITLVLRHIAELMANPEFTGPLQAGKLRFYVYDGTPLGLIWVDDIIYSITYLPCVPDRECPQLILASTGRFSEQLTYAITRLRDDDRTRVISKRDQIEGIIAALTTPN